MFDAAYAEDRTAILRAQSTTTEEIRKLAAAIERRDKDGEYVDNQTRADLVALQKRAATLAHHLEVQNEIQGSSADLSAEWGKCQEAREAATLNDVKTAPIGTGFFS